MSNPTNATRSATGGVSAVCVCAYPCDCGSPAAAAEAALADALAFIGDQLRRERLAGLGIKTPILWEQLQDYERRKWVDEARAELVRRGAA